MRVKKGTRYIVMILSLVRAGEGEDPGHSYESLFTWLELVRERPGNILITLLKHEMVRTRNIIMILGLPCYNS